jgi:hypothetical protein
MDTLSGDKRCNCAMSLPLDLTAVVVFDIVIEEEEDTGLDVCSDTAADMGLF